MHARYNFAEPEVAGWNSHLCRTSLCRSSCDSSILHKITENKQLKPPTRPLQLQGHGAIKRVAAPLIGYVRVAAPSRGYVWTCVRAPFYNKGTLLRLPCCITVHGVVYLRACMCVCACVRLSLFLSLSLARALPLSLFRCAPVCEFLCVRVRVRMRVCTVHVCVCVCGCVCVQHA